VKLGNCQTNNSCSWEVWRWARGGAALGREWALVGMLHSMPAHTVRDWRPQPNEPPDISLPIYDSQSRSEVCIQLYQPATHHPTPAMTAPQMALTAELESTSMPGPTVTTPGALARALSEWSVSTRPSVELYRVRWSVAPSSESSWRERHLLGNSQGTPRAPPPCRTRPCPRARATRAWRPRAPPPAPR
jgi:hypothetical protein